MCTETKIETQRRFVVAIVASLVAAVTFAVPQAWQTTLTQAVMPSAEAADRYFYRPTVWYDNAGQRAVSIEVSTAAPVAIPDNNRSGIQIPIRVPNPFKIGSRVRGNPVTTKVKVSLDIKHSRVSDLVATLTSPDGRTVQLFHKLKPHTKSSDIRNSRSSLERRAGEFCSGAGMKITLVESASEELSGAQCPSGAANPSPRGNTNRTNRNPALPLLLANQHPLKGQFYTRGRVLQQLNGDTANGTWTLHISDHGPGGTGAIVNANLTIVSAIR